MKKFLLCTMLCITTHLYSMNTIINEETDIADILANAQSYTLNENYEEAFKLYRFAAENGNTMAQYALGCFFHKGLYVEQSYTEAYKWYCLAAEQGHIAAQNNIIFLFEKELIVKKNSEEKIKWYIICANNGNVESQINLGNY